METIKLSKETLKSLEVSNNRINLNNAVMVIVTNLKTKQVYLKYVGVVTDIVKNNGNSIFLRCLESEENMRGLFADVYFGKNPIQYGSVISFKEDELQYVLPLNFDLINSETFKDFDVDVRQINKMIYRFMPILSKDVVWGN